MPTTWVGRSVVGSASDHGGLSSTRVMARARGIQAPSRHAARSASSSLCANKGDLSSDDLVAQQLLGDLADAGAGQDVDDGRPGGPLEPLQALAAVRQQGGGGQAGTV